ncbi:MAG TPA: RsmE family RNA methyltransferase [Acidimicrobiales bacterium]
MTYLEWPRRVAAVGQFRVDNVETPNLDAASAHHLRKVLRARHGEEIVVTNGNGSWAICVVDSEGLTRVSNVHLDPEPPATSLYLSPLKGDHGDWAVVKATEVGVRRIVPLMSQRGVVKMKGDSREKVLARWRRLVTEAAGQCRRTYDVIVDDPIAVANVPGDVAVCDLGASGDWRGLSSVAVGPEGGWAPDEWDSAHRRVGLGPTVLRAETAGVLGAALLAFQAGGWGFTLNGVGNG